MIEEKKNPEIIKKATENYQKEMEKIKEQTEKIKEKAKENPKVESFLDKFTHQQILHQKLLQKLETQVSPETLEKIKEVRKEQLERFQEIMLKFKGKKEAISEKKEEISEWNCIDSDERENYYYKKGSVKINEEYIDSCKNSSVLREGFCKRLSGGEPWYIEYKDYICPFGCKDGKCESTPSGFPIEEDIKELTTKICKSKIPGTEESGEPWVYDTETSFLNFDQDKEKEILTICHASYISPFIFVLKKTQERYNIIWEENLSTQLRTTGLIKVVDVEGDGINEIYIKGSNWGGTCTYSKTERILYSPKYNEFFSYSVEENYYENCEEPKIITEFSPNLDLETYKIFKEFLIKQE